MKPSFSFVLSNLFVALCKGHPALRPYSTEFRRSLQYELRGFELEAVLPHSRAQIKPDMAVESKKLKSVLVLEWTTSKSIDKHKEAQLNRYAELKVEAAIAMSLASPGTKHLDVTILKDPTKMVKFSRFLKQSKLNFPLIRVSMGSGSGVALELEANNFSEGHTHVFFERKLAFERVPLGYLPFSLDSLATSDQKFRNEVAVSLIGLLIVGVSRFTTRELAARMMDLWDFIGDSKQQEIIKKADGVLTLISGNKKGRSLLRSIPDTRSNWSFVPRHDFGQKPKYYKRLLADILGLEPVSAEEQLELDLDSDLHA